jgi:hypothetical protein
MHPPASSTQHALTPGKIQDLHGIGCVFHYVSFCLALDLHSALCKMWRSIIESNCTPTTVQACHMPLQPRHGGCYQPRISGNRLLEAMGHMGDGAQACLPSAHQLPSELQPACCIP